LKAEELQGMAKRILIVSYHFYPDAQVGAKRMSELARMLCDQGHELTVISATGRSGEVHDPKRQIESPGLTRIRIPAPPKLLPRILALVKRLRSRNRSGGGDGSAVGKDTESAALDGGIIAKLKRFYLSLEWLVDDRKLWSALVAGRLFGLMFSKPFDVVISSGPPMSAHLAVLLARQTLRCRWVMDMRDPWCDQDHHRQVQSGFSRRMNRWLEGRAVGSADAIVLTTPGYKRVLQQQYVSAADRMHLILNGFDSEPTKTPAPRGKLELLYAGSLYYNRDPFPLLRAVKELVDRDGVDRSLVSLRFVGKCDYWNGMDLEGWILEHGLEDCISIHPPVAAADVGHLMEEANVLVNFAQGQPMQIPAKTFDYISAQREILLITEAESDTAWIGRKAGCARIVPPGDDKAMSAALLALYHDYVDSKASFATSSRPLDTFSRRVQNEHFIDLLEQGSIVEQEVGL
jgi:glycosyltransferase involved in cell wall biosynthesis